MSEPTKDCPFCGEPLDVLLQWDDDPGYGTIRLVRLGGGYRLQWWYGGDGVWKECREGWTGGIAEKMAQLISEKAASPPPLSRRTPTSAELSHIACVLGHRHPSLTMADTNDIARFVIARWQHMENLL